MCPTTEKFVHLIMVLRTYSDGKEHVQQHEQLCENWT